MSMQSDVVATVPLSTGYAYDFAAKADVITKLAELVRLEHECCRFLTFKIIVGAGDGPIRLEVTGPSEARKIISDFFGP